MKSTGSYKNLMEDRIKSLERTVKLQDDAIKMLEEYLDIFSNEANKLSKIARFVPKKDKIHNIRKVKK